MASQLVLRALQFIHQYNIKLTVRQIYYRLVAAGYIKNSRSAYNTLDKALTNARLEGEILFSAIEDRTRQFQSGDHGFVSPEDFVERAFLNLKHLDSLYESPYWLDQPEHVEVWVEKDALSSLFLQEARAVG
jgi:hypothetical protein